MPDLYERPYGLGLKVDHTHAELGSANVAAVTLARIQPIVEKHGGQIVFEGPIVTTSHLLHFEKIDWLLSPMDMTKEYDVPASVYHRINAIDTEGVVFHRWIWGEEQFPQPKFKIATSTVARTITQTQQTPRWWQERRLDPIIIGVVITNTDDMTGIWCCLGKWLH